MADQVEKVMVEITNEEATELVRIIDYAVKQMGVEDGGALANSGLYFVNKLNEAFKAPQSVVSSNGKQKTASN